MELAQHRNIIMEQIEFLNLVLSYEVSTVVWETGKEPVL